MCFNRKLVYILFYIVIQVWKGKLSSVRSLPIAWIRTDLYHNIAYYLCWKSDMKIETSPWTAFCFSHREIWCRPKTRTLPVKRTLATRGLLNPTEWNINCKSIAISMSNTHHEHIENWSEFADLNKINIGYEFCFVYFRNNAGIIDTSTPITNRRNSWYRPDARYQISIAMWPQTTSGMISTTRACFGF